MLGFENKQRKNFCFLDEQVELKLSLDKDYINKINRWKKKKKRNGK